MGVWANPTKRIASVHEFRSRGERARCWNLARRNREFAALSNRCQTSERAFQATAPSVQATDSLVDNRPPLRRGSRARKPQQSQAGPELSTPPTVAPRANAIPLPFGTHQDSRLRSSHTPHACSQPCCTRADIVTRVPSTASESSAPLARAPALTCAACHLPVHRRIAKVWTHDVSTPSHPTPQLHRLLLKYATIFELRPRPLPRAPCRAPLPLPP